MTIAIETSHCGSGCALGDFIPEWSMIIGYFTSWPANGWLVNRGIKVPM